MKRRAFITLVIGLAIAWPFTSYAQQPKQPLKRVGVLTQYGCPLLPDNIQPDNIVVRRLEELGWIEGQTIVFDCVSAVGRIDQVPALARELVSRRPDVLIANPWLFVSALKRETTTIPIVMLATWEPVRLGLIGSFARPEGNVTGIAWLYLLPKQMELLKEIVPNLRRVAFITNLPAYSPPEASKIGTEYQSIAASTLGFTWQVFPAAVEDDYDEIFTHLAAEHFDAVYIPGLPRHRIPAVSESPDWAKCGLLLTYGQDIIWTLARAMGYVDKILHGAKPSDLPVEQAAKFDLVVNLKTAKTLGLTVPPSLIARADEVIE
jgi:putative tryptophan/tyrosine transport system substrate-binding protein